MMQGDAVCRDFTSYGGEAPLRLRTIYAILQGDHQVCAWDGNFSRKLRTELTPRERNKLMAIVDLIADEQRRAEGYDV